MQGFVWIVENEILSSMFEATQTPFDALTLELFIFVFSNIRRYRQREMLPETIKKNFAQRFQAANH